MRQTMPLESGNGAEIIRRARKKLELNQKDFAGQLGKSQSVMSRYESGAVIAPSTVIMHCMHILNEQNAAADMDELIKKLQRLDKPQFAPLRSCLNQLLDALLQ